MIQMLQFLALFSINALLTPAIFAAPEESLPNILFIAIDDLRPALGCYGDTIAKSPRIDAFAKTARQFNHAYVQQAVCGPSRTSILTGLLPDHTRVWHNRNKFRDTQPNHITLPQRFKQNGYTTLALGKIFSGNESELDPISWSSPEILKKPGWSNYVLADNKGKGKKQSACEMAEVPDNAYPDGQLATLAIKTLTTLKQQKKPFFLATGFFKPHLPFSAPKKYWDMHDPASFEVPKESRASITAMPDIALHTHRELGGYKDMPKDENVSAEQLLHLRHGYYACVSYIDQQVGRLLDALQQLDLDRNTIVILCGDHGFTLGEQNRWCKATNFELDTRVPLLIRTPWIAQKGIASDALVELVDLYPTLTDLAGIKPPDNLDGQSFRHVLDDPSSGGRNAVLSQFNRPWESTAPEVMGYSIRTSSKRYTRWIDWQNRRVLSEELYDYSSKTSSREFSGNRFEHKNIAQTQPEELQTMSEHMDKMFARRLGGTVHP